MALTWVVAIFCIVASAICLVFCIGFDWGDRPRRRSWRSESYRQARLLIATLLFSSRSGAPDFGGIAKLAEAIQKLTPSGQLLIGAVVFAAIAAVLGGVGSVTGH